MITPVAISSIGYQYYIVYACIGCCIPFLVYFYFPESMSRTLEEMDLVFKEQNSVRAVVRSSLKPPVGDEVSVSKDVASKKDIEVDRIESRE